MCFFHHLKKKVTCVLYFIVSEGQKIAAGLSEFSPLQDIFNRLSQGAKLSVVHNRNLIELTPTTEVALCL